MDREGLRVVPEAVPDIEQKIAQPADYGAVSGTAPGDHVRAVGRRGTFRALRSRPFRLYFAGLVASASGTFVQQTAIGWLVLRLTGSPAQRLTWAWCWPPAACRHCYSARGAGQSPTG